MYNEKNNYTQRENNQTVLRGDKYNEYTIKEPVNKPYYDGDIWNPITGETLKGKYIDYLENAGKFNKKLYVIESDRLDGKYDKIFGCASLDNQMEKIEKGTDIEIAYHGKNQEKNYHDYEVSRIYKPWIKIQKSTMEKKDLKGN